MKNLKIPSQQGFSLIEMVITVVIVTIFIVGISTVLVHFGVQNDSMSRGIETDLDSQLLDRTLARDLMNSSPTMNNINIADDSGRGFFDFYPDIAPTAYTGQATRTLTLQNGHRSEFFLIVTDTRYGAPMLYDPTAAYDFGSPPANMNTQPPWTFVSVNRGDYVTRLNPQLWRDGRVLMLDTPARNRSATGTIDPSQVPRSPLFLGEVAGNSLLPVAPPLLDRSDPANLSVIIDSADTFFRRAPPMSGGSPVVRLRAVQVVRYYMRPSRLNRDLFDLYRQVYAGGRFQDDQLFGRNLQAVQFIRSSIFQPILSYKIYTEKNKLETP